jgi:fumarate reductase flavoprotein subunit
MKQLETDIAIVGAGSSGLAAGAVAVEKGAKVMVFEKASTTGGTGNMANGIFAVETRHQLMRNVLITKEEAFKKFMEFTHWRVDARLVSNHINMASETIEWLEGMGIEIVEPMAWFRGAYPTHHQIKYPAGGGFGLGTGGAAAQVMKVLTEKIQKAGGQVFLQTKVTKIIKEKGKVTGLMAEDRDGQPVQVKAKAVIVGTGGFGDNEEMIKKYTRYEWGKNLQSMRIPGMVGEGIRMAWEAGAAPEGLDIEMLCGVSAFSMKPGLAPNPAAMGPGLAAFGQPNLMVNVLGERFVNEEVMGQAPFAGHAVNRQKGGYAFVLFDGSIAKHYQEHGVDWVGMFSGRKIENVDGDVQQAIKAGSTTLFAAGSLDELAAKAGINAVTLKETVKEYNQACETGRDYLFHKNPQYLRALKEPNYYAGKAMCGGYGSLGGIKINWKTEVLTKDQDVIPGLYAVGVDANSIYGDSYIYFFCGNTLSFALNSGRMAGGHAADYVKTVA